MAEGGEDPSENPYSFKKFSKKTRHGDSPSSEDGQTDSFHENPDILEVPNSGGLSSDKTNADEENCRRKEENPFSFKKFLRNSSSRPKVTERLAKLDLANDLPDFIQDHSTAQSSSERRQYLLPTDVPLPDFALDSNPSLSQSFSSFDEGYPSLNIDSGHQSLDHQVTGHFSYDAGSRQSQSQGYTTGTTDRHFVPIAGNGLLQLHSNSGNDSDSDVNEDDPDEILAIPKAHATGGLPDFLSDSAVNSIDIRGDIDDLPPVNDEILSNGDYALELRRLQEENRDLRMQLDAAKEAAEMESRRLAEVRSEMETQRQREAAETAAMEKVMQQVEENLSITTQRAVRAENTVSKLRQEIKSLQAQLKAAHTSTAGAKPNEDIVKEKAKYASQQLASAAKNAEQTLQQLMSGVETLKLVSSVLASIDKVTDAGADGNTDDVEEGATGGGASAV